LACKKEEHETMNPEIVIRSETNDDICAISEVTIAAFETLEISNHTEQFIIDAHRAAKPLTVSLVTERDGRVIGHIAFSPVTISDGTPDWHGLGPACVLPEHQQKGIGKALISDGLSRLKDLNAHRRLPRRIQSGWPTRGFRQRRTARLTHGVTPPMKRSRAWSSLIGRSVPYLLALPFIFGAGLAILLLGVSLFADVPFCMPSQSSCSSDTSISWAAGVFKQRQAQYYHGRLTGY
jgi:predicted N-acetyltransferase YhbS